MYLLYLDWNAMKGLKGTPSGVFADFAAILERYRDRFWIPYSSTHLDDLARGYDPTDERKVRLTTDDLVFISQLTQDRCFQAYHGRDKPEPDRRDPIEFFHSHYEAQQEAKADFASLATRVSSPLDSFASLRELMLDLPSIPFPDEAQSTFIANLFPGWSTQGTTRSIVQDMADLTARANSDYTYSTEIRDVLRNGLPMLKPAAVSSATSLNAFDHIEKLLAPYMMGRSMLTIMDELLKNPNDASKPPTLHQRFVQYYYILDLFGYHSDSLSKKNHFPNIMGDATHAFLGGHCDFFVTDDKRLRDKAQAVYQKLRTHTYIVSVAEFVKIMTNGLPHYTPEALPNYLRNAMRDGKKVLTVTEPELPSFVLPYSLFDTFNAFELRQDNSITFFRIETTYRHFDLSPVIEQVITFLDSSLGPNDNGMSELEHPLDTQQLMSGTWRGRQWSRPGCTATLLFPNSLELTIDFEEDEILANN
jgi:hypothetical protein